MLKTTFLVLSALSALVSADDFTYPDCEDKQVVVQLFEWSWDAIARECEDVLGPKGFCGVQARGIYKEIETFLFNNSFFLIRSPRPTSTSKAASGGRGTSPFRTSSTPGKKLILNAKKMKVLLFTHDKNRSGMATAISSPTWFAAATRWASTSTQTSSLTRYRYSL